MNRFKDILADLPYEHVILASKIVDYGKERLGQPLNQSILVALADHLGFVIKRLADHLEIQMPLLWDIQHIYPAEFDAGLGALELIKKETGIDFPNAEAAALALHFINAEADFQDMPNTIKASKIINNVVEIVESHLKTVFDEKSFDFISFITLLRNTIMRFIYHEAMGAGKDDDTLFDIIRKNYVSEFTCAGKIAEYIEKEQDWRLTRNDVSFLALHISRLMKK
jgi:beta-glucoside operon transcriptional antiterminator